MKPDQRSMDDNSDPTKCHTSGCDNVPMFIVYWPGTVPPPRFCPICSHRALEVADAMGVAVHVEGIRK